MGVTVETWVLNDPSKLEEHDQFFMKWVEYGCSTLGESAPRHRCFAQRDPVGGRVLTINFNSDEDERARCEITEHIAEKMTLESGFTTSSSDVVLSPVYRDLPKDKAQTFIRNSEKIHPKLIYEERPPESGNPNAVDIVAYLSEDMPPSTEKCQVCGTPLPYLSNKCTKCGAINFT